MVMNHVYHGPILAEKKRHSSCCTTNKSRYTYAGNTNSLKWTYKQKLKLDEEYEEHKRITIKEIQLCFDEDLSIDLELEEILVGYLPMEVYEHI